MMRLIAIGCLVSAAAEFGRNEAAAQEQPKSTPFAGYSAPAPVPATFAELEAAVQFKLAEIRALEVKIADLRREADFKLEQILLQVRIIQLSPGGLDAAGEEVRRALTPGAGPIDPRTVDELDQQLYEKSGRPLVVISEPKVTFISGRPATLIAGGEIPVIAHYPEGQRIIEYKDYGARVDALGVVRENGNIWLELRARVSELDPAHSVTLDGETGKIPRALQIKPTEPSARYSNPRRHGLGG